MGKLFLPTITLNSTVLDALTAGTLALRPGQWVRNVDGRKGQYLATHNGITYVAWNRNGECFTERTQRVARAVWHRRYKHLDAETVIRRAPMSVGSHSLGEHLRERFLSRA